MPTITRKSAPEGALCTGLMQAFVASLSAGAILGIAAAAGAAAVGFEALGPMVSFPALILGMATFPPLGGLPLKLARCILRVAMRVEPEDLWAWETHQPENRLLSSPTRANTTEDAPAPGLAALLPPLLLLSPFYGAAIQWTTSWYVQALYCNRSFFGMELPACLLQGFERLCSLAVLTCLISRTRVLKLRLQTRLGLGCVCAALAMFVAAAVEVARRDWTPRLPGQPEISSLSIAWLLPQFALIAAGEAFVYPATAEFLSSSAFAYGLGCAVQAGVVALLGLLLGHLKAWIPDGSPNQGHYDLFYLCFGVGGLAAAVLFVLLPFPASCQRD
ncbi:NPF7.1 [Symbiodinium natans]|uniref:NPF7.1 protein n=1 Tax=Symbiodinium natans TaxID=878477 RepID=A0A812PAQ1_9DINO|nr:NPF7.1 [Symbiodinium natans]